MNAGTKDARPAPDRMRRSAIAAERRRRRKKVLVTYCLLLTAGLVTLAVFAASALDVRFVNGTMLTRLQIPEYELPEFSQQVMIAPGETYTFDVRAVYGTGAGAVKEEISDRSSLRMFFSDSALCVKPAYNAITIAQGVPNGTVLDVTLKIGSKTSSVSFLVADSLSSTLDTAGTVTNQESESVVLTRSRGISPDYVPENLTSPSVLFAPTAVSSSVRLRPAAASALEMMFSSAKDDRVFFSIASGYRSYIQTKQSYDSFAKANGASRAEAQKPAPGHDEAQTGLLAVITAYSANYSTGSQFASSAEGKWLAAHAWEYGFIIRYPAGSEAVTGYPSSPSTIRYVGPELAALLHESNICLEEFFQD